MLQKERKKICPVKLNPPLVLAIKEETDRKWLPQEVQTEKTPLEDRRIAVLQCR